MLELLLYANMSCIDAAEVLERAKTHEALSNEIKAELIEVLQEATPHCDWDAND